MHIRPTELGWKGLLLLTALLAAFFASNYNNLFFLLIVFCSALGALGLLWSSLNLRGLTCTRLDVPLAAAGQPRLIQLDIRHSRGGARGIHLQLVLADEVVDVGAMLVVDAAAELGATVPPRPRGITSVRAVRLSSRFPFGLFRCRVDVDIAVDTVTELVTYPAPVADRGPPTQAGGHGEWAASHGGRGSSIAGLRAFRSGDAVGDMHWKATAKRGLPIVREREPEADRHLDLVFDRRAEGAAFETALSGLSTHVLAVRSSGRALTVHSQGGGFTVQIDRGSEAAALRWLANITPLPAGGPAPTQSHAHAHAHAARPRVAAQRLEERR